MPTKGQIRDELEHTPKWDPFVHRREQLVDGGMDRPLAWQVAYEEITGRRPMGSTPAVDTPDTTLKLVPSPADEEAESPAVIRRGGRLAEHVPREKFAKPTCQAREAVEWVAANIAVQDVVPENCPGPEAWALLCWVRKNDGNLSTFWTSHYTKLMPTKSEVDGEAKRHDDGEDLTDLIGTIADAAERAQHG